MVSGELNESLGPNDELRDSVDDFLENENASKASALK